VLMTGEEVTLGSECQYSLSKTKVGLNETLC
jgi:hypothetical protein